MSYQVGDHLLVMPKNSRENVERVFRGFPGSKENQAYDIHEDLEKSCPPIFAEAIESFVELNQPASKKALTVLANATKNAGEKSQLRSISSAQNNHLSVLDLLERFPNINLPLVAFLDLLPPLKLRQYSISSSSLVKPDQVSLTFEVLDMPSLAMEGRHVGVASSYLGSLQPGDCIRVAVRPCHDAFRPPAIVDKSPIIMISAGTGIAPFRGFIQERAAQLSNSIKLSVAFLFHGCREADHDDLYAKDLTSWQDQGAVKVYRTYSRTPEKSNGNKYVQDALWAERAQIVGLWIRGAKIYICGSQKMGQAVAETLQRMLANASLLQGDAKQWWNSLRNIRYAIDVFD